ncbi:FAD-binding protein [Nocardia fusca]|uniref:FAD-binding protein n=1 Tax=Nocardia fusca TaxID=941183 RepID=UPI0037C8C4B9
MSGSRPARRSAGSGPPRSVDLRAREDGPLRRNIGYSGGSVWLPGNRVLARQGVDDSVEKGLTHFFRAVVGDRTRPEVQQAYLETGPAVADFLENTVGISLDHQPFPDYFDAPGRSDNGRSIFAGPITADEVGDGLSDLRPMVAADQFGATVERSPLDGGQAWIARMVLALDATGRADLLLSTGVDSLAQDESGEVTGVVATAPDGTETRIRVPRPWPFRKSFG